MTATFATKDFAPLDGKGRYYVEFVDGEGGHTGRTVDAMSPDEAKGFIEEQNKGCRVYKISTLVGAKGS